MASRQLHRPRSHNARLTRCYVGTLKCPASSGRPLDPSALRLNEWRKNALDCRSGTLTAASKHIGSSAARAAVQHMAARHRCRHCCCKGRAHEDEQQERRKAWTVPMECWTACGRLPDSGARRREQIGVLRSQLCVTATTKVLDRHMGSFNVPGKCPEALGG